MLLRRTVPLVVIVMLCSGCATSAQRPWGEEATARPGFDRLRAAALTAIENPRVWIPVAGAAAFQVGHWDRRVSNWASTHTPIFGSQENAANWSDRLRTLSSVSYYASVAATPGAQGTAEWLEDKAKGVAVGLGAIAATDVASLGLKTVTRRERPNGQDNESFPSAHASRSAVTTGLARDNLESVALGHGTRLVFDAGLDALTIGTAWARVEAGVHFPADTLTGIALGNFFSTFFDTGFLSSPAERRTAWSVTPLPGGAELTWAASF